MAVQGAGAGAHEDGLKPLSVLITSDFGDVDVLQELDPSSHADGRSQGSRGRDHMPRDKPTDRWQPVRATKPAASPMPSKSPTHLN